jgi:hypothetical protein
MFLFVSPWKLCFLLVVMLNEVGRLMYSPFRMLIQIKTFLPYVGEGHFGEKHGN